MRRSQVCSRQVTTVPPTTPTLLQTSVPVSLLRCLLSLLLSPPHAPVPAAVPSEQLYCVFVVVTTPPREPVVPPLLPVYTYLWCCVSVAPLSVLLCLLKC